MTAVKKPTRKRVFERDHYACNYCGRKLMPQHATVDHVVPRSHGGSNKGSNLITACKRCNRARNTMPAKEFNLAVWIELHKKRQVEKARARQASKLKSEAWKDKEWGWGWN